MSLPMKFVYQEQRNLEKYWLPQQGVLVKFTCVVVNDYLWRLLKSCFENAKRVSRRHVVFKDRKAITCAMGTVQCEYPRTERWMAPRFFPTLSVFITVCSFSVGFVQSTAMNRKFGHRGENVTWIFSWLCIAGFRSCGNITSFINLLEIS